ncbi:CBS domain-containing protein [Actinomadura roseirufa]|uniref:CBS domain-containing protein n=1 Tax=Actinomadura roseirufa TaxID=2094049 RepID=UPI00104103E9|nr:CBS domain-containing protein [Actinomadura roseirufa]
MPVRKALLVREAMTSPVVTIPASATVRQAVRVLYEHDVAALPVVEAGLLVGVAGELDLLRGALGADPGAFACSAAAPGGPAPRRVGDVMIREVETARPDGDVAGLAELMMKTGLPGVPVLDGPDIVGMVGRRDLVAVLAGGDARVRDDVLAALAEYGPDGPGWEVSVDGGVVELRGRADAQARRVADMLVRAVPGVTGVTMRDS